MSPPRCLWVQQGRILDPAPGMHWEGGRGTAELPVPQTDTGKGCIGLGGPSVGPRCKFVPQNDSEGSSGWLRVRPGVPGPGSAMCHPPRVVLVSPRGAEVTSRQVPGCSARPARLRSPFCSVPGVTRELGHRCHRGTWLRWGGFVHGGAGGGPGGRVQLWGCRGQLGPTSSASATSVSLGGHSSPPSQEPPDVFGAIPIDKGKSPVQPSDPTHEPVCAPHGRAVPTGGLQGPPVLPPDQGSAGSASLQAPPGAPSLGTGW